ncbi:MAG: hypothetical protein IJ396_07115 [Oscillibacter sp.]|nr:hypothetical protein [Oscillibacter sp.]
MKNKLIMIVAALLLTAGTVWWFLPRPAVDADFKVHLVRAGVELENVTEQVDTDALAELLQGQTRGRFRRRFAPTQLMESTVDITGMDSRGHWHFSLDGETQVVYESAEKGGWPIKNGEELLDSVWKILNQ